MKGIEINQADVAASFQKAVVDVLVEHSMDAVKRYHVDKFAIAGGVASMPLHMCLEIRYPPDCLSLRQNIDGVQPVCISVPEYSGKKSGTS